MTTTATTEAPARSGHHVDVDGVPTYYEVTGTGDPVVLLHGGLCTAETLDPLVPALAERYQVIVPERPGHGRTPDVDGPITYEGMAQHTIAFLEALGIESAHLGGWSDGALIALLVALRRPKLVRKVVFLEQFVTLEGAPDGYLALMGSMTADEAPPPMVELYEALSPDGPDHFEVVFEKLHEVWVGPTGIEVSDLERVAAPTLLLLAEGGSMTLAHIDEVRRALPESQLAIVPGASHGLPLEKPHVVSQLVLDFLADEQVPVLFPMMA
jgi:pimeloyl-ACP methyl ester carboxylesterase